MKPSPYMKKLEDLSDKMPNYPMFLLNLLYHANDMIVVSDIHSVFVYVNDYAVKKLGWSKEDFLSSSWEKFVHPDDREKTASVFKDIMEKPNYHVTGFANRYMTKDGEVVPLCWNTTGVIDGLIYCIARHCPMSGQCGS